jgi:hypothetical protein
MSGGEVMKYALFILAALSSSAFAQPGENPIPASGGAIIFADEEEEPKIIDPVYRPSPSLKPPKGELIPINPLPDPLEAGWKGEKVCEVLQENEKLRALKCAFAPGVGHERHYHSAHFGYILQGGKMRIKDSSGIVERDLPTGGTWKSDGVDWHEAVNIGETTAIYLIVEPKETK